MTPRQTIELRMSEQRQRINELLGKDEKSDEERTELGTLTGKMQGDEVELRAAIAAEPPPNDKVLNAPDGEGIELRALVGKANIAGYLTAAAKGNRVDGAQAELNEHMKLSDGYVPMEVLVPRVELRTKTGDVDTQVNAQSWVDVCSTTPRCRISASCWHPYRLERRAYRLPPQAPHRRNVDV